MQQVTEIPLGSIQAYGTLSGYVYLHIPRFICKQFGIIPATVFDALYRDGKIIFEQVKEKSNAT